MIELLLAYTLFLEPVAPPISPYVEVRQCGAPLRGLDGSIKRDSKVIAAYRALHACPATGLYTGPCPGWSLDHEISLVCGGCDSVSNMHWMPNVIKSGPGLYPKDRWEQRIYCLPMKLTPMPVGATLIIAPQASAPAASAASGSAAGTAP